MTKLRGDVDGWLETKVLSERTIVLFRLLYLLTKTRGYKTIGKLRCKVTTKKKDTALNGKELDPPPPFVLVETKYHYCFRETQGGRDLCLECYLAL